MRSHARFASLLLAAIAGCGGGGGPDPDATPSPTPGSPAPSVSPASTASPAPTADAGPLATWASFGPEGGDVVDIAVAGERSDLAYAATSAEVWRSDDGTASWRRAAPLPYDRRAEAGRIVGLCLSHAAGLVFAATESGVYRSGDRGDAWVRVSRAIEIRDERFLVLAIACGEADGALYVATYESFHRSDDGAESWTTLAAPPAALVVALAVDPMDGDRVFAGQVVGGARSDDRGATWTPLVLSALPFGGEPSYLLDFAFDRTRPRRLWTAAGYGGVYESGDAGASWRRRSEGIAPAPFQSEPGVRVVASLLEPPEGLLAAAAGELYASANGGQSWRPSSTGLAPPDVSALALDPVEPHRILAGTLGGGVFQSLDSGATWASASRGLHAAYVRSLAVDPVSTSVVYAGTGSQGGDFVPAGSPSGRIFRSADRGRSWTALGGGLPTGTALAIAVDPAAPSTVFAAIGGAGILRSDDAGETWRRTGDPDGAPVPSGEIVVQPSGRRRVVAALGSLRVSADGGESWSAAALQPSGEDGSRLCQDFTAAAVDPHDPERIYAVSTGGVVLSEDGGATWEGPVDCSVFAVRSYRHAVVPDPVVPNRVYATIARRLAVSDDGGRSFAQPETDLPEEEIEALAHDGSWLYAAVGVRGVFRSKGDLRAWEPWSDGLGSGVVQALAVARGEGATLFAATSASGVAVRDAP